MPKANCVHSTPPTNTAIAPLTEQPALSARETSTRRRFLSLLGGLTAGSAALSLAVIQPSPVAAEPASPPAAAVSEDLVALSEEVRARHQAWIDAGENLNDVINGLRQWEAEHPEPRPYDDEGNRLPASLWADWNEKHKKALKRYGKMKALNAFQAASVEFNAAISEALAFQATTMTDLYFKAELAFECDNDSCHLSSSVIEDLLDMSAGVSA